MTELPYVLEQWPLDQLRPHPENPRKHPKPGSPKWSVLEKALSEFNWDPIKVNRRNGLIISGHLRASILRGMPQYKDQPVPVMVYDVDELTHKAMLIAANRLLGEFEETALAHLAGQLSTAEFSAALAGFTDEQLMGLVAGPETVDDGELEAELVSAADKLQQKWQVQLGDLYEIEGHRLLCGECANADNWQLLTQGRVGDMAWIDPPYNIDYAALQQHRNDVKRRKGERITVKPQAIINDKVTDRRYDELLRAWFKMAHDLLKPGGAIYIAHADSYRVMNEQAAIAAGLRISQNLVWVKNGFTQGHADYQNQHEPVLYGWRPGAPHYWQGGFNKATVIDDEARLAKMSRGELVVAYNDLRNSLCTTIARHPRSASSSLHPTIKPLKLVADHIWNSSRRGELVIELFGGSGTTPAAAHQTGRLCYATELSPTFAAVILERMSSGYGLHVEKMHGPS